MTHTPTFDEILAAITEASAGNTAARVAVPDAAQGDDTATKVAIAVNHLLDTFAARTVQLETHAKNTQAELERLVTERTEQLRQSEETFTKAFRSSPAAISIAALPEGRWLEINDAFIKMTGYNQDELIGRTSAELNMVDTVARAKIVEAIQLHGAVRNVEIQLHTKANTTVDVLLSVEQVELNGQTCGLTIQYDITDFKNAEREILRLNADLEHRQAGLELLNKELESFSYSVAHDLRTPLRSIDGFSHMLMEDYADILDAEGRKYLQHVREAAQHMSQLIDDLLMLSRVTRSELRRERVDMSVLARSVLVRLGHSEPGRAVEMIIADEIVMDVDAGLLRILLENLLGNAWKFTSQCPLARIEVGSQKEADRTVYFVRDNGVGFDMAYVGKLFGVFQRLHTTEFDGTGIGLATVQRIIRRHGGQVWAEGAVGQGASIYFTLNEGEVLAEQSSASV